MVMLDLQHYGYAIAGIFFGLWLVPLGHLTFKSGMFPKVLGIVLVVGGIGYLFDTLAAFVAPELTPIIHPVAAMLGLIAEVSLLAYLLVKGVRDAPQFDKSSSAAPTPVQANGAGGRGRNPAPPSRRLKTAATDLHGFNTNFSAAVTPKESIAMIQSPTMIAKAESTYLGADGRDRPRRGPDRHAEGVATFVVGLAGFL